MGVDTTTHLYQVLYLEVWLKKGIVPTWNPNWYGGTPFLWAYPPLAYYLTVALTLAGLDPILAYKIVDSTFYCLAPITLYFLAREFSFDRVTSAASGLLFSLFPIVIENYLQYDRFTTVLSMPVACVFLILLHRGMRSNCNLVLSSFAGSVILLIHHLSALIVAIMACVVAASQVRQQPLRKIGAKFMFVAVGSFGVAAVWLGPFIQSIPYWSDNPFYNPNVLYPFIGLTNLTTTVILPLLGISCFVLAMLAVSLFIWDRFGGSSVGLLAGSFIGCLLFQIGVSYASSLLISAGQCLVIFTLAVLICRLFLSKDSFDYVTLIDWFLVLVWIGLGYYAMPVAWLPYTNYVWLKSLDLYRVWLYVAIPISVLAASILCKSISRLWTWRKISAILLIILVASQLALGAVMAYSTSLNSNESSVLPFGTRNAVIPSSLIRYFKNDNSTGRILGINVPLWIYLLPIYTGKPLVDGWYPQSKLLTPLKEINDYRIDDLELAENQTVRIRIWNWLISKSDQLEITWIVIGGWTIANAVVNQERFRFKLSIPYNGTQILVFKSTSVPNFSQGLRVEDFSSPTPNMILLTVAPNKGSQLVVIKEAFFPTWRATANGSPLSLTRDKTGYIQMVIPPETRTLLIYQDANLGAWAILSLVSLVAYVILWFLFRLNCCKNHI